jgi:hypothetical protein
LGKELMTRREKIKYKPGSKLHELSHVQNAYQQLISQGSEDKRIYKFHIHEAMVILYNNYI